MALWNRKDEPTPEKPAAQDPPATPAADDKIDKLTAAVATLAENQIRSATPAPVQYAAPQLPTIPDISDAELDRIYDEGDQRQIRQAEDIRRNAATERLRREMGSELATFRNQGLSQLNRITKQARLREDPNYSKDAQYKKDVDALVAQVEASGAMLTEEALEWIQHKVTGQHHTRLVESEFAERTARQAREAAAPARGTNPGARGLPPEQMENYGLGAESMQALQHLNRGRGRTPDEFAAELPGRKVSVTDNVNGRPVTRIETRRYTNFGDTLRDRQWAEKEFERQQGIMTGEISPNTPITPRN